jgi:hypothetical protein
MLDLNAPIVPGVSAAGFHIGQFIEPNSSMGSVFVLESIHNPYVHSSDGAHYRYRSDSVDLWTTSNAIQQIGVHGAYHGKLLGQITLGMTIDDIERFIGPCMVDDEDNLAITDIGGLCFDVALQPNHFVPDVDWQLPEFRFSPITWLYVLRSQTFIQYLPRTLHQAT